MRTTAALVFTIVFCACSTSDGPAPEAAAGQPPDLTGWTRLPVENVSIERQGETHLLTVKTTTSSAGWTVDIVSWTHPEPPNVWKYELAGRPAETAADQVLTIHEIKKALQLDHATKWIEVNGQNGAFKHLVPWMPAPAASPPPAH